MPVKDKVEKRLLKKEKRYEREQLMKEKRSEDYAVLEEVFDKSTLMTIYRLLNQNIIKNIYGVVESGKEARVYYGVNSEEKEIAIKIYLTISSEFKKGMRIYIQGDPRFQHVRTDTRSLIYTWAKKEYKNLMKAYNSGVHVPKPIYVEKNVLIMKFYGKKGVRAPLLKEKPPKKPELMYQRLMEDIKKLYKKARLVHADLSEYNIMNWRERPIIFDMSQAVLLEHPMAEQFLRRDLENLNHFFLDLGVEVKDVDDAYRWIIENG